MAKYNPLRNASLDDIKELYFRRANKFTPSEKAAINEMFLKLDTLKTAIKSLVRKIERYEDATGFDFIKESQKRGL